MSKQLQSEAPVPEKEPEQPPPVFRTWGRFYAVVVANTLFIYLLLVIFSAYARP